jgi:omega-amidase
MTSPQPLRIALGEYDIGWHDPTTSLDHAASIVDDAAARGARLVVLPEMCTSGFTMDLDFAESLAGEAVTRLSSIARSSGVWLLAGVPTRDEGAGAENVARNSALVIDPAGEIVSVYHKQRLFTYANEQRSYRTGDTSVTVDVDGVRVSPFICYDLRFPELFRRVASDTDVMIVIASWPAARRTHWDVLLRARAIENQCYVIGVNRTGEGGSLMYDGGSAAFDPWGIPLERSFGNSLDCIGIVQAQLAEVQRIRTSYPFLADCR